MARVNHNNELHDGDRCHEQTKACALKLLSRKSIKRVLRRKKARRKGREIGWGLKRFHFHPALPTDQAIVERENDLIVCMIQRNTA